MARSQYIYIWTEYLGTTYVVGPVAAAFTVKAEALAPGIVGSLPGDHDLYRYYDGFAPGEREPVLVATKRGVLVEETKQSWRPRNEDE